VDRPRYVRAEYRSAWYLEQHQADNDAFSWTEPREEAASSGDDDDDGDGDGDGDRDARAVDDGSGSDDSTPPQLRSRGKPMELTSPVRPVKTTTATSRHLSMTRSENCGNQLRAR